MSECRVCDAGEIGQRLHKCPNSKYYVLGSDPGAEYAVETGDKQTRIDPADSVEARDN